MKKITTLLLAILMVLPAMAATFKSGDVIYLSANIWETGGAKFSANFDYAEFSTDFGVKTLEGYYKFTVPGNGKTYSKVCFVRNTNEATIPAWDPKWNETIQYAAEDGKNLFTVNAWSDGEGGKSTGSWSTYVPQTPETLTYSVTVPEGTPACYIAGEMNGWSFTAMTKVDDTHYTITYNDVMKTYKYKYTCGQDWVYVEKDANGEEISDRTWSENDVVAKWNKYPENITAGTYLLLPGIYETEDCELYAIRFENKNDASEYKMQGYLNEHVVYFDYKGAENYTHMTFYVIENDEAYATPDNQYSDIKTANVLNFEKWEEFNVIKESEETTYQGKLMIYNLVGEQWQDVQNPTGVNRVELADGIGYAYGVVSAEGAIEVYNVNGAVVARGNDNVDLRGLGRGVYIIRNGNQVRKVVR